MLKLKNENEDLENYDTLKSKNKAQLAKLLNTIDEEDTEKKINLSITRMTSKF